MDGNTKNVAFASAQISLIDIREIHTISQTAASNKLQAVKRALGKPKFGFVSIREYCNFYKIDLQDAAVLLNVTSVKSFT